MKILPVQAFGCFRGLLREDPVILQSYCSSVIRRSTSAGIIPVQRSLLVGNACADLELTFHGIPKLLDCLRGQRLVTHDGLDQPGGDIGAYVGEQGGVLRRLIRSHGDDVWNTVGII